MAREEIIAKLASKYGHHKVLETREPDEDHRHKWTVLVPSGDDSRQSSLVVFKDDDGHSFLRPLTYGEIADALLDE